MTTTITGAGILTPDQRVRVFISSTLGELHAERATARQAVSALGFHPVMFESGARPHPTREWYLSALEQSHIYIGIFADSYGEIVPGLEISGIEDEIENARDMPRLVYVRESSQSRDPRLEDLLSQIRKEATLIYHSFSTKEELAEAIRNDVSQVVSEVFILNVDAMTPTTGVPTFLQRLQTRMQDGVLLDRLHVIEELKQQLEEHQVLQLTGEPGLGKTYILGSLASQSGGLYMPIRRKSTQQVFSYLANQLSAKRGRPPRRLLTEHEARIGLEQELAKSSDLILIDEADGNPAALELLLGMDFLGNRLVFATRSPQLGALDVAPRYDIPRLAEQEIERYLDLSKSIPPPGEKRRLIEASRGNPLYLYYYTQHAMSPPPEGLIRYERFLWDGLDSPSKEIMSLVTLSFAPLSVSDLCDLLGNVTSERLSPMQAKEVVDSIEPLLRQAPGQVEIFHPHFEEFVQEIINVASLAAKYHKLLGAHAVERGWIISAAYHLLKADDPRARQYLPAATAGAIMRGNWSFAEELLQRQIEDATSDDDDLEEARARYSLSTLQQEMGRAQEARDNIDCALELLQSRPKSDLIDLDEFVEAVKLHSLLLKVDEGNGEEALDAMRRAAEAAHGKSERKEAFIKVNFSYVCIQLARFREGAQAARRALEIFTQLDDQAGIYTSLTNLAGCVGNLGEEELQEEYAHRLIDFGKEKTFPRIEAAGLNHLAIAQRRQHDYEGAKRSLAAAIELSQVLGSFDMEAMNIANLGNVYRDEHRPADAEGAYREALQLAQDHNLPREEAQALELLARLKYETASFEDAAQLGEQALQLHEPYGNALRTACTHDYLGRSYAKLGRHAEAATSDENAGRLYELAEEWRDAAYVYQRASALWSHLEEPDRAYHCTSQSVRCAIAADDPDLARRLVPGPTKVRGSDLRELYLQAVRAFLSAESEQSMNGLFRDIAIYSKRHSHNEQGLTLKDALSTVIAAASHRSSPSILNGIAVGVEQAGDLLSAEDVRDLAGKVALSTPHLYYREVGDLSIWTIGFDWPQPMIIQLLPVAQGLLTEQVAMTLALILLANRDLMLTSVQEVSANNEPGLTIYITTQQEFEKNTGMHVAPYSGGGEPLPASVSASNTPWSETQPPTLVILHDEYKEVADWTAHPNNKALVWLLMNVFRALVAHATHTSPDDHPDITRLAREFCERVLL